MVAADIRQMLLQHSSLRIELEMAKYVEHQLTLSNQAIIPVIGGDARTGLPTRLHLSPNELRDPR